MAFCFVFFGNQIIISDQLLTLKLVEIDIALVFHSIGNPNGCTLDYFFSAVNIRHNFSYKLIPKSTSYLKYF